MGAVALGTLRLVNWFDASFIGGRIEAEAATNLDKARELVDQGNAAEARALLEPILARVDDPNVTLDALVLNADIELQHDNKQAAIDTLATALERYPTAPEQPAISLKYARLLEETGRYDEAAEVFTRLRESAPPAQRGGAISGLARQAEREGKLEVARDLYKLAVKESDWGSDNWEEAAEGLGRLNVAAIFSPKSTADSKVYRVEPGDTLTGIGMKLNTTQGLLMRANNISDPRTLRVNQNLKYTPKDFKIIIERSTRRLFLMDSDGLFKLYTVGLGKPGNDTTVGRYRIGNKEKHPTWFKPGYGAIPPGDPRNELGTRWMPLIPEEEGLPTDLGIHGTIEPETIGKYTSMGCPRLLPDEVEELYDLVVRSTPVIIVEKYDPNIAL